MDIRHFEGFCKTIETLSSLAMRSSEFCRSLKLPKKRPEQSRPKLEMKVTRFISVNDYDLGSRIRMMLGLTWETVVFTKLFKVSNCVCVQ